ncbi:MAG: LSU ribosomal protein L18p (L5e) [Candidatus Kapaibacterium sp.]|jgi:large subunit ribosomal protein L18|nr:MAG: LSU ribosomal protein L18p (L5e) [Candidatus Kapabacteria bacterium]ROL58514.1 MAG: 50S ribosomal protein L18 [Bacteroidetes/Chlorobi group bacterium Naka2016]
MNRLELKKVRRTRRKLRVRKKIYGTAERPRLTVFRSLKHIYCQVINDDIGHTLVACSTLDKEVREKLSGASKKVEQAKIVGQVLAQRALKLGIEKVAFDRNGYLYHGRVKALAEGAREGGLKF